MTHSRRIALATLAAPLALALAACNGDAEGTDDAASLDGEPIADVAAPDGQVWSETVQVTEKGGYLLGNPDAPLKLVEYGSLTCGACANFAQTGAEQLKSEYVDSGVVSFELRNLSRDAFDTTLNALVRCGSDESFHPLSDQVWLNWESVMNNAQQGSQQLQSLDVPEGDMFVAIAQVAGMFDFFAARGLSRDQAASCLADASAVEALGRELNAQADADNVSRTPTFILNGQTLQETSWPQLEGVLQRAGARDE